MFLFTPRVRTGGGPTKLASSASPGITPELPAKKQSEGSESPGAQFEAGLGLARAGPAGGGRA